MAGARKLTGKPLPIQVEEELTQAGLSREAMDGIISATRIGSLPDLQQLLGADSEAFVELQTLFSLAEGYGIAQYLQLDTSCVRGLAYYTGAFPLPHNISQTADSKEPYMALRRSSAWCKGSMYINLKCASAASGASHSY